MTSTLYITGNQSKYENARQFFEQYGIEVSQQKLSLDEIQSDDGVAVAVRKAEDAYKQLGKPLFVNDASWLIPSLNGFPGPYMRYLVEWFTIDDILSLMKDKQDRTIILRDTIVYTDGKEQKVFTHDTVGRILEQPKGAPRGPFITQIVSLRSDGTSLAEDDTVGFSDQEAILWDEFGEWLKEID